MEYSDSYQNGGSRRDADFQKLAQNIGSNIQKILQNGKNTIPDFTKMVSKWSKSSILIFLVKILWLLIKIKTNIAV